METVIHTPGKLKVPGIKRAFEEYQKRIQDYKLVHVRGYPKSSSPDEYLVALDRKGRQVTTGALSGWLENKSKSISRVRFLIGGKQGLSKDHRKMCEWEWSLSGLDMNQSIAVLVVAEQLYRCFTNRIGHPYH